MVKALSLEVQEAAYLRRRILQHKSKPSIASWTFAAKLRELRGREGLTQSAFAERLSVPKRTYIAWEAGSSIPSLDIVPRLVDEFAITPAWLFQVDETLGSFSYDAERIRRIFSTLNAAASEYGIDATPEHILVMSLAVFEGVPKHDAVAIEAAKAHFKAVKSTRER